jgi:hypothetical protein
MSQRLKRFFIVVGVVSFVGIGSTIAFAKNDGSRAKLGGNPFGGISAVASTPSGEKVLDPSTASMVRVLNARYGSEGMPGLRLASEARVMPGTVNGQRVYLIPTDKGALCVVVEADSEMCASPLSATKPALVTVETDAQAGAAPTVFGIAMDGVRKISLMAGGAPVSVPVRQNLFVLHGGPAMTLKSFSKPSVTFSDGRTVQLP